MPSRSSIDQKSINKHENYKKNKNNENNSNNISSDMEDIA